MLKILLTLAVFYVALVALLYVFQRRLIYLPDTTIGAPTQYGLDGFAEHFTTTGDDETLLLWHRPPENGFPTVLYFHGNASHLGNRAEKLAALADKGFGVLAVSYRGYGKSSGYPSEQGLYSDARAALEFLERQWQIRPPRVLLYGESLGTGVAVHLATEAEVGAVILEAPYMSVSSRAAEIYRFVPVRILILDHFKTIDKIGRIAAPLLLFHGERDDVIPIAHGRAVFEAAPTPKQAFFLPGVAHNDFDSAMISAHVLRFAETHRLIAR